jgi:uncharacterized protein YjbI with pentapeptide repeats
VAGGVTFRACNLNGAILPNSLQGVTIESGYDGTLTTVVGARFPNDMTGLNLVGDPNRSYDQGTRQLIGANLSGVTIPIWFADVNLTDVIFPQALWDAAANCSSITGWNLEQSFMNPNFTGFLGGVYFMGGKYTYLSCTGTGAELVWGIAFYIDGQIIDTIAPNGTGYHDEYVWRDGTKFDWTPISNESFAWMAIPNFDFTIRYSGLVNCDLTGFYGYNTTFPADISNSNFEGANLVAANFSNVTNATGANFSGADLTDAIYPNKAFFNGVYYVGGQATELDADGIGVFNGLRYENGALFTGDFEGNTYVNGVLQNGGGGGAGSLILILGTSRFLGRVKFAV